jgi:RHS repeat-associated protein
MAWDFRNQLQRVDLGGGGTAYYVYDAAGQRIRKVVEKNAGNLVEERITLGGFEVFRRRDATGTVSLERETLHVMDDRRRVAMVDTRTVGDETEVPVQLIRYQLGNHLGSACLELDGTGQIITYEEYYPYGSTSYQAGRSASEVSLKRYRYTGMERDEETGLNHHGARYYAPWLGRWTAADPMGLSTDGVNLYAYVADNPVGHVDPSGLEGEKSNQGGSDQQDNNDRHERLMKFTSLLGEHGARKSFITHILGLNGDDKVLAHYGYTPPGKLEKGTNFQGRVRQAILSYHLDWQANHGGNQTSAGPVSAAQEAHEAKKMFIASWLEGLSYVVSSLGGAVGAGIAMHVTDDQKKITAAAGLGDAASSAALSLGQARGNKGTYSPTVENEPFAAKAHRAAANEREAASDQRDVAAPRAKTPAGPQDLVKKGTAFAWKGTTNADKIQQVAEAAAKKGAVEIHIATNAHGALSSSGFVITERKAGAFFPQDARTQGIIQSRYPNASVILHDIVDPAGYDAFRAAQSRAVAGEPGIYSIGGFCYSVGLLRP